MHTLDAIAKALHRSPLALRGLMSKFELPVLRGAGYSDCYREFLRTLLHLRTLNVAEAAVLDLWRIEKALLRLLHADSTGSTTWFLDACGSTGNANRRLLLSNFDVGVALDSNAVQLGLDFRQQAQELFPATEMSVDELAILRRYCEQHKAIVAAIRAEVPQLRATLAYARTKDGCPRRGTPTAETTRR